MTNVERTQNPNDQSYLAEHSQRRRRGDSIPETSETELIYPSTEWAWMMGVIAGGGTIHSKGRISFTHPDPELRKAITSRGERLFGTSARIHKYEYRRSPTIDFGTLRYARALGNFTRDAWVDTILENHDWVLRNDRYTWAFLEGFFETRANIYRKGSKKYDNIELNTAYRDVANFLAELMVRVGVENPKIRLNKNIREDISGVELASLRDVKHFAEHVHSVIPKKEEKLAFYRDLDLEQAQRIITPEDVIREWNWMVAIVDHAPSRYEVERLKKLHLTEFDTGIYIRRFGKTQGQRSLFSIAKDNLEEISKNYEFEFNKDELAAARRRYEEDRLSRQKPRGEIITVRDRNPGGEVQIFPEQ